MEYGDTMSGCEICNFKIIRRNYVIGYNMPCAYCHRTVPTKDLKATYRGLWGGYHHFRLHPQLTCSGCKEKLNSVSIPCKNGIDVTDEFEKIGIVTKLDIKN